MKKMRPNNFLVWYYGSGIADFLEIWKNYLYFFWHFFSVSDLVMTLLSPWKKDVSFKDWRGFDPARWAQRLLNNIFSRVMGAIVRVFTISFSLILMVFTVAVGAVFLAAWLTAPLLIVFGAWRALTGDMIGLAVLFLTGMTMIVAVYGYFESRRVPYPLMNLRDLYDEPLFERICARLGITRGDFLQEWLADGEALEKFLKSKDLEPEDFTAIVQWEVGLAEKERLKGHFWRQENLARIPPFGKDWKYAYTVHLDRYSQDLTMGDYSEYAAQESFFHENELEILKLILKRPQQNNILLTGNPGIGRKSIVHYLARQIRHEQVEEDLRDKRVVLFDLGRALADVSMSGEDADFFLRRIFAEATYAGNVILVVENLETYLRSDSSDHRNIAPVLNEYLDYPTFNLVATSTQREYHNLIEHYDSLMKFFEVVEVQELDEEKTIRVLLENSKQLESESVVFGYQGLKNIVRSSTRYGGTAPLPERAIDLASETFLFWRENPTSLVVDADSVNQFLTMKTGIPLGKIEKEEKEKLLNLEKILHQRVIGQEEAVKEVAEAMRKVRSGIGDEKRPVGSFLFLGPTGVGKTETAKALAQTFFDDENRMIRLDMSEFQHPSSVDTLIGSSQAGKPGRLTSMAKDNPSTLLLLDEIEKAYPDVLDIFLQILDEGFVTDGYGDRVNFRNMIIIATSNAGAVLIKKMVERGNHPEAIKEALINHIVEENIFRVEFLNRFDNVIFYRPLDGDELVSVTNLLLKRFARRLDREKNMKISFASGVVEKIIEDGYNPIFGARSINRYVGNKIEDLVAMKIIEGVVIKGEDITITVADLEGKK